MWRGLKQADISGVLMTKKHVVVDSRNSWKGRSEGYTAKFSKSLAIKRSDEMVTEC